MYDICFNCGEEVFDESDIYYTLVGKCGIIYFCEDCGKHFNIPNCHNKSEYEIE